MSSAAGCGSPCRMELGRFMWAGHSRGLRRAWCEGSFCHLGLGKKNRCCENSQLMWLPQNPFAHHKMWGLTHCRAPGPALSAGSEHLITFWHSLRSSLWTWGAWLGRLWCKQKIFLWNSSIFFSEIWIILLWVGVSEVLSKSAELATGDREHEIAELLQWIEAILFSANMLWQEECWWHSNQ